MAFKKTFYDREFKTKRKNYSDKELIYYFEILPLNRRSAILENPSWKKKNFK